MEPFSPSVDPEAVRDRAVELYRDLGAVPPVTARLQAEGHDVTGRQVRSRVHRAQLDGLRAARYRAVGLAERRGLPVLDPAHPDNQSLLRREARREALVDGMRLLAELGVAWCIDMLESDELEPKLVADITFKAIHNLELLEGRPTERLATTDEDPRAAAAALLDELQERRATREAAESAAPAPSGGIIDLPVIAISERF